MLKQAAGNLNATRVADAALAASRQVWLAGLGAAIATRDWARNDAGNVFRTLVKEGEVVEKRAMRVIGRQVDSSFALATTAWNKARHAALSTVNGLVDTAASRVAPKAKKAASRAKPRQARRSKRSAAKH